MKSREVVLIALSTFCYLSIIFRLFSININRSDYLKKKIDIFRFSIYDKQKRVLSFNQQIDSICANPSVVPDCVKSYVSSELGVGDLSNSSFLWIKRDVDEKDIEKVKKMNIPGIYVKKDWKRVYPFESITSNLIGFCDKNMNGKYGIEYAFNDELARENIYLTIDARIQAILFQILENAMTQFKVEGASGLVIDAQSGEILAMVSIPCPKKPLDFLDYKFRNRNLDPVEVGSILKLHNVAMALETGGYELDSMIDGRGPLRIARFEINDFFGVNDYMTLRESVWRSSNIANARVALQIGSDVQKNFFEKFGFLENIEWIKGCYAYSNVPTRWKKTTTATLSYGYGIGITSLHLARSILRIIHGYDIDLSILRKNKAEKNKKVILSAKTSHLMRQLIGDVIKTSTSKTLKTTGYCVGGKTGTANICIRGKYVEGRNFVTMACLFPTNIPRVLILLQMKDPKKSGLISGRFTTASNVWSDHMAKAVRQIGSIMMIKKDSK